MPFIGEVAEIIPGTAGLTGSRSAARISPGHLIQANNVEYVSGTVRKEGGALKYNAAAITGAPAVLGGHDWWPDAGTQRMVVLLSDGTLKKDSGAGTFPTTLVAGLSVTDVTPIFVDGGQELAANPRKLFIFTGLNQCKVLNADGVVVTDIASPPGDWTTRRPVCGEIHENRLWGASRHTIYASLPTNHEDFTTTPYSLPVYPGVGDDIAALLSFKGMLLVFKRPVGIYAIDTSDTNTALWRVNKVNDNIGIANPRAVTQIDDDVVFETRISTLHLLSAIREFADVKSSSISAIQDMDTFTRTNLSKSNTRFNQMVYYQDKRELHVTDSTLNAAADTRNFRVVLDMNDPAVMRFRTSDFMLNRSLWLRRDSRGIHKPVVGDNNGFVWLLDDAGLTKDGAGYTGLFQTAHLDLSHVDPKLGSVNKIGKFLEVVGDPDGNWLLTVEVYWDGVLKQTIQFNLATAGAALGTFTLGTHALGGNRVSRKRRRLVGQGKNISLLGKNGTPGEGFAVIKFYLYFKRGGESEKNT